MINLWVRGTKKLMIRIQKQPFQNIRPFKCYHEKLYSVSEISEVSHVEFKKRHKEYDRAKIEKLQVVCFQGVEFIPQCGFGTTCASVSVLEYANSVNVI